MNPPLLPLRPGRQSGFSLIEVLVALVLVGTALLMGMELALQNPRIVRRTDAERQAFRAMESTLEAVRAGAVPLTTAKLGRFMTAVDSPAPKDLEIAMTVERAGVPGLFEVTLSARYTVERRKFDKRLKTMVWSPPKAP
ncbi:MAG TPA: type II secretion system protein [Thermoanaerobaculia bacterium]|nr:type II secretion system protein [Thermoanaerobaculia bacterium]